MPKPSQPSPSASEPCVRCGEETAVGSPLFAGRRRLEDRKQPVHLCETCDELVAASRGRRPRMTDEELRQFIANGSMAMIAFNPMDHPPGGF